MASNDYGTLHDSYTRNRAKVITMEILNRIQPVWLGDMTVEVFRNSPAHDESAPEVLSFDIEAPDIDLDEEEQQRIMAEVEQQTPDLTGLTESDKRAVLNFQGDQVAYADSIRLHIETAKMQADRNKDIDRKVADAKAAKSAPKE